ncbi:MAG TPA: ABC transporter permease [Tepidisphaeraceae bacterium]|jgi:lipoprotein-releasing system permease protein|nr:ABC transporter permease [Tepidisphaeraceae bacterium]
MRWFITYRYLFSHKRQSLVCIAGVTISVTMFIAMSAMMAGFTDKFIIETVESSGHITIKDEPRETRTPILEQAYPNPNALLSLSNVKPRDTIRKIGNPTGLLETLQHMPGIVAAAPEVFGDAIATYGTKTMNLNIHGIEPERQVRVTTIGDDVLEGSFQRLRTTADGVVIGKGVADTLGARLEDSITLASSTGGKTTARVVGIFRTGVTPVDYSRCYMLINSAQTLLDKKNIVNEIVLRTSDYTKAREYASQIEGLCGYRTESWQESNANFLKIFNIQQVITYIITGALLVVAAFGVLNILIMAVLERINDIAILRSFGLSRMDIGVIYTLQGMVIGLVGASVGLLFGKLAVEGLRRIPVTLEGLIRSEGLLMSEHPSQYYLAFISAIVVVLFASAYPAWRAAKYDPVEVIRGAH